MIRGDKIRFEDKNKRVIIAICTGRGFKIFRGDAGVKRYSNMVELHDDMVRHGFHEVS